MNEGFSDPLYLYLLKYIYITYVYDNILIIQVVKLALYH